MNIDLPVVQAQHSPQQHSLCSIRCVLPVAGKPQKSLGRQSASWNKEAEIIIVKKVHVCVWKELLTVIMLSSVTYQQRSCLKLLSAFFVLCSAAVQNQIAQLSDADRQQMLRAHIGKQCSVLSHVPAAQDLISQRSNLYPCLLQPWLNFPAMNLS